MTDPRNISIHDFTYDLPEEKIALHPLEQRDASKLLVYQNGNIRDDHYRNIAAYISPGSLLVFNNSKVINARIRFQKSSGGMIEIFCLEPAELLNEYSSVMNKKENVKWKCFVGGAGKWKSGALSKEMKIDGKPVTLHASLIEQLSDAYLIEFSWSPVAFSFAEIIESAGDIPLPPYIKRKTDDADASRYQTIYAAEDGSVAAPTAGLHFSEHIFSQLSTKKIGKAHVTLHVGAGTFKPVKAGRMQEHEMHAEWIDVDIETIELLSSQINNIIAVGTTSMRTIETLYWLGVKATLNPGSTDLTLKQWDVYEEPLINSNVNTGDALNALIQWMKNKNTSRVFTQTQLLIVPGYKFRMAKALVTNFHQPQSTLLLLVAAAVGEDWKMIYNHALQHEYRFLSYGDGNLIFLS